MPYRKEALGDGGIYHVFNRGVEKRNIFYDRRDYRRFYNTLIYYLKTNVPTRFSFKSHKMIKDHETPAQNLVEIYVYCLMPNHFHMLLRQNTENGISTFIGRLSNSYTKYFNTKHKRVGHLFQGPFKAVKIESDELLLHVSRYIHLNPLVGGLTNDLSTYEWSSYLEYIGKNSLGVVNTELTLDLFPGASKNKYRSFVLDQADYGRTLELAKHQTLD
ncbi:MAG: transposase [Candidatus Woykebacteria bacterium]